MSVALPIFARGRHKPGVVNARLRRQVRELDQHNAQLVAGVEQREDDLHTALLRGCQDAILIAQLRSERDEYAAAVARMEKQHGEEIRAHKRHVAELARRLELRSRTEAVVTRTQEIPVITPVMPLNRAPFAATNPGHVPSWAREDDTVPVPAVRGEGVAS